MKRINDLLAGKGENYILPFFWQHGEDEATLRDYVRAIDEANIHAVCVECRPHPDFCGPKWWEDLDVILDEAKKRNMKVWILDDDHFPTGHANGGIENADISLRPWYVETVAADCYGPSPANRFDITKAIEKATAPSNDPRQAMMLRGGQKLHFDNDIEILSVVAWELDENGRMVRYTDVSDCVKDGVLVWDVPNGSYRFYVTFLTHNGEGRTDYINILDHDSVRVLIDKVYEEHYARYKDDFGKTILGFFSDEPMVGNIMGMYATAQIGGEKKLTNPWQKDLPAMLEERLGSEWKNLLGLLWTDGTDEQTVAVRQAYMDAVTRLIEKNFAGQLAEWCEAHGVEYIGHIWEDAHLSSALGGGLGHYFRAMNGNHMGGVDIVFNNQMKPWSDHRANDNRGGADFYYYVLGKYASSHAAIDPHKQGRAMCEIFGATGWDFGVDKMKYLADNFLVNGVNHYVPHAFSPKAFPDPDCPPHYYAHGENAQYRHFGRLMAYMQRVCHLLNGGKHSVEVAVLYNAESDWVSELSGVTHKMFCETPAQELGRNQIDYDIIPIDLLEEGSELANGVLTANGITYKALIVPATDYTSPALVNFSKKAKAAGFPVLFIDVLPQAVEEGKKTAAEGEIVALNDLAPVLRGKGIGDITISPATHSVKYYHYCHEEDLYMIINNDLGKPYEGVVTFPNTKKAYIYDAYENVVREANQTVKGDVSELTVTIRAYNPLFVFFGEYTGEMTPEVRPEGVKTELTGFKLSSCPATQYPNFGEAVEIEKGVDIAANFPKFMDFYRYETEFEFNGGQQAVLQFDYISDGTEVWVNDVYCGQRIAPEWIFDLTKAVKPGKNILRIEVAATPNRKVLAMNLPEHFPMMGVPDAVRPEGIIGSVNLFVK